jgi:hypothetical protein
MRTYIIKVTSRCCTFSRPYTTGQACRHKLKSYVQPAKLASRLQCDADISKRNSTRTHHNQHTAMPRQDYGIDFYGVYKGEIMLIVDLFTRETILTHLNNRTQDGVAFTILKHIIFQRGVPRSLRTDNAPELSSLTGAVSSICEYLKIDQVRMGGHNPRGNSICQRVNQSLGSMIRKLNDQEYKNLGTRALPAFQFALNTTFNSAIGCTPFEAGHGLAATTIAQARLEATRNSTSAEGGRDGDTLEDVDQFFDQSIIKDQMELAVRMAEVTRATSEWHRRMTDGRKSKSNRIRSGLNQIPDRPESIHIQTTDPSRNNIKGQEGKTHRSLHWTGKHH